MPPAVASKLALEKVLDGHDGCVNRLAWNEDGSMLASASDDCQVGTRQLQAMQSQVYALSADVQYPAGPSMPGRGGSWDTQGPGIRVRRCNNTAQHGQLSCKLSCKLQGGFCAWACNHSLPGNTPQLHMQFCKGNSKTVLLIAD